MENIQCFHSLWRIWNDLWQKRRSQIDKSCSFELWKIMMHTICHSYADCVLSDCIWRVKLKQLCSFLYVWQLFPGLGKRNELVFLSLTKLCFFIPGWHFFENVLSHFFFRHKVLLAPRLPFKIAKYLWNGTAFDAMDVRLTIFTPFWKLLFKRIVEVINQHWLFSSYALYRTLQIGRAVFEYLSVFFTVVEENPAQQKYFEIFQKMAVAN